MNKGSIIQLAKTLNLEKVGTTEFLVKYYRNYELLNAFQAAEEAEKKNNSFIDFLNCEVTRCSQTGEVCLFQPSSNRNVTFFNLNFFFVEQLLQELYSGISNSDFEIVCSKVLKYNWGVQNANVTKATSDGGYDFYGSYLLKGGVDKFSHAEIGIFGQSKQYKGNISRPEIEKFLGFIQKNNEVRKNRPTINIFATTSDFSSEAIQLANKFGIICWTGMQIASFIFNSLSFKTENAKEALLDYLNN